MIIFETTRDTTFNKQLSFSSGQKKIVSESPVYATEDSPFLLTCEAVS